MATERAEYYIRPMYFILPPGGNDPRAKITVTVTVTASNGREATAVFPIPAGSTEIDLASILPGV